MKEAFVNKALMSVILEENTLTELTPTLSGQLYQSIPHNIMKTYSTWNLYF